MGCHIIRSLKGVGVAISILGNKPLKETFQIPRSRGVRIFKNHKARARMPDKNSNHALPNGCALQDPLHLRSDFIEPRAKRRIVLADQSKWQAPGTVLFSAWEKVNDWVVDQLPTDTVQALPQSVSIHH